MAEENMTPVAGAEPPPAQPISKPRASTLKLKPVIRRPTIGATGMAKPTLHPGMKLPTQTAMKPEAAAAPEGGAIEQLKTVTQKLKGVTQQIPQQAILHKTGIIADQDMTEAQKQASKSRTARISLSDAIGVAPVKNDAAPMKTIRIKRPVDIQGAAPAPAPVPAAPVSAPAPDAPAAAEAPAATMTQRKTLKISRPGASRPTSKFSVKKAAPEAKAEKPGEVAELSEVADMQAVPAMHMAPVAAPANGIRDVPKGLQVFDLILQIVACVAIGFLSWKLYLDTTTIFAF